MTEKREQEQNQLTGFLVINQQDNYTSQDFVVDFPNVFLVQNSKGSNLSTFLFGRNQSDDKEQQISMAQVPKTQLIHEIKEIVRLKIQQLMLKFEAISKQQRIYKVQMGQLNEKYTQERK